MLVLCGADVVDSGTVVDFAVVLEADAAVAFSLAMEVFCMLESFAFVVTCGMVDSAMADLVASGVAVVVVSGVEGSSEV